MTILTVIRTPSGPVEVYVDDAGRLVLRPKPARLAFPGPPSTNLAR